MSAFTDSIDHELQGLEAVSAGPCPGCSECFPDASDADEPTNDEHDLASEPHFSWSTCECCGSRLGGDRHPAHGLIPNADGSLKGAALVHFDICVDCLLYLANGDEPESWES